MAGTDNLTIDLSNYKDKMGSRVAPGDYLVVVEDTENDRSSNNNPMVNVWFRIIGTEFDGQTIVDRLTITEKALFRVVGFMQAIGLPTPKKRLQVNTASWRNKRLIITVDDGEPYNGRIKSEVRSYSRATAKQVPAEDGETDLGGLDEFTPEGTSVPVGEHPVDGGLETGGEEAPDPVDLDKLDLG